MSQLAKDGRSAPLPLGKPAEREKPGISPLSKAGSPLAPRRESASLIFRSAETESPTFRVCLAAQRHQWPGLATCNQFSTPVWLMRSFDIIVQPLDQKTQAQNPKSLNQ